MNKEKNAGKSGGSATSVRPIPEGFHTITPIVVADGATGLIEFIKKAFDGEVTFIMKSPEGKVQHATVKIGDSTIMLCDSSDMFKPMPCMLQLYVEDVDSVYKQAIKAGGTSLREPIDEFYGDRSSGVKDAWDNQWWIATHVEDLSDEEVKKRAEASHKQETANKLN